MTSLCGMDWYACRLHSSELETIAVFPEHNQSFTCMQIWITPCNITGIFGWVLRTVDVSRFTWQWLLWQCSGWLLWSVTCGDSWQLTFTQCDHLSGWNSQVSCYKMQYYVLFVWIWNLVIKISPNNVRWHASACLVANCFANYLFCLSVFSVKSQYLWFYLCDVFLVCDDVKQSIKNTKDTLFFNKLT